ncbi:N-acetyltransferase [Streptomyces ruber]|uniref:N-acetyltransferase n=2 Tax=Streptomyces TaxID=1883 RepID=A0A918BAY2_9ACTN|nr:GNAT family N-acetyltransferase [Streptomyces ruber]GGQ50773.1 N-acetyltransferase [Streptomyces ruber]
MTGLVIRTLDESTDRDFDTLPDPLDARASHARTRHRPDWKRIALRDGRVVARGAWWGGADDTEPRNINWFDVAEGEEEAGAELLRTAPWRVELEINLPGGWRDAPHLRAAAGTRFAAARAAGYELLAERYLYRWTPRDGLPGHSGRLRFAAGPDDAVFLDALRRIHSVTLDAHALTAVAEGGVERAAQQEMGVLRRLPSPREWWRVAYTDRGEPVGIHVPARNTAGPCVGFVGVLPERRGHGYAYDLLAECTRFLVGQGAGFVAGATDRGNRPMVAHFARAGFPVVRERIDFTPVTA